MHARIYKFAAGTAVALSLFGAVGAVQASTLTQTQVSAIISLLQSFGADQGTISNVSSALGGQTTSNTLSCASFSDVSYGQFDNNPGGRVSQLQTWLGIPSTTFGFGTYGKKTQALWNATCGGVGVSPSSASVSAYYASLFASLSVNGGLMGKCEAMQAAKAVS